MEVQDENARNKDRDQKIQYDSEIVFSGTYWLTMTVSYRLYGRCENLRCAL